MSADTNNNDKMKEEILLSKRMFIAGCFGLPWLWICNALYFRLSVFNPIIFIDYWPGHKPNSNPLSANGQDNNVNGDSADQQQQQQTSMEQQLEEQVAKQEISKWVKRSTKGAILVCTLFVAWIITFQVNKDSFSNKWFVMDPTDAEVTGW